MSVAAHPDPRPAEEEPLTLRRLLPPGDPATVQEIVESLDLHVAGADMPEATREGTPTTPAQPPPTTPAQPPYKVPQRPYVALNMVSTTDGRATVRGRSGPIGNRADRELFHGLRSVVDAVMVGAGTVRVERYGRIVREESRRRRRRERGLSEEPLACIVSGRLSLPSDIPLLADPAARVVIVTSSAASLPECAAHVDYIRAEQDGLLDLPTALAELRERFGVHTLLCEGGPHLNAQLLAAGLVDELFLCLSPKLAGGDLASGDLASGDLASGDLAGGDLAGGESAGGEIAGGEAPLRILAGPELVPPAELELLSAFENESHLFLRYRVRTRPEGEE